MKLQKETTTSCMCVCVCVSVCVWGVCVWRGCSSHPVTPMKTGPGQGWGWGGGGRQLLSTYANEIRFKHRPYEHVWPEKRSIELGPTISSTKSFKRFDTTPLLDSRDETS